MKKAIGAILIGGVAVFGLLQLVHPGIPEKPVTAEVDAPPQVKEILERNCYTCHSDQRRLSWFDQIEPGYWLVRNDILTAREHLNFSTLGSKPAPAQKAALYEAVNMIQLGAMPLPRYARLHPEARMTEQDLAILKNYLSPWSTVQTLGGSASAVHSQKAAASAESENRVPVSLASVQPEFNGVAFDPNFEGWKVLSTTDRGDNNTFRFILGNDIAVAAARSGHIMPWPEGSRIAKIAWQQQPGSDGLIHPGKFVQVELMVKNAKQYKNTDGWGWGRWRGLDLKPYGKDARFVNECTGCHMPVRANDYVYTTPITSAMLSEDLANTRAARLPASLPYQPLGWRPVTLFVDPATRRTAALYGNDAAMSAIQPRHPETTAGSYPSGSVLALVTWVQRDDPHWFGGRIPDLPFSVEFVQVTPSGQAIGYRRFAGASLAEEKSPSIATQRTSFIMGLKPAPLP